MKKNTHPLKQNTVLIFPDGSTLNKKWVLFKKILKIDSDFLKNKIWKSQQK